MAEADGSLAQIELAEVRPSLTLAVAIATSGRRDVLTSTIDHLATQSRLPDRIFICPASEEDMDGCITSRHGDLVCVVRGDKGSSAQRNAIIKASSGADVIVFFDDDFLPQQDFLKEVEKLFLEEPEVVIATGKVLADGASGPGLTFDEGREYLDADPGCSEDARLINVYNGYGCNMAVRLSPVRRNRIFFDEVLPLYGWWEDVDLSRRLAPYGMIVKSDRLRGVHLGSKRGRSPGRRLGYSQVANLVYLVRKGSVSPRVGLVRISRNFIANLVRSLCPEDWVDRRGRLVGNLLAIRDVLRGSDSPLNILSME